jgi:hypothetical protein
VAGDGLLNQVLRPAGRPDPCTPGKFDFVEENLAHGAAVRASRQLPDQPAEGAVDGTTQARWGAGDFAPQWIQIDLGAPRSIAEIRLVVAQSPDGNTLHEVWGGGSETGMTLLHVFDGPTTDGQVLRFQPAQALDGIRYLRIVSRESPSWIGWQEIEVLAP